MNQTEKATLAGGCFWCTEAIFRRLKGVTKVESGFTGGNTKNPDYWDVVSGKTGHAESIQITFDPQIISFEKLLEVFWATHDPTTLNRQNYDVGTQYRSAIFYHSPTQKEIAEKSKQQHQSKFKDPIVTEITPFSSFYKADENHQKFYEKYQGKNAYCTIVIDPKIQKLSRDFKEDLKT